MARTLAELKEPGAGNRTDGVNARSQRQAALPPEEEPRSSPREPDSDEFADCDRCPRMSVVVATDFSPRDTSPSARRGRPVRTLAISRSEVTVAEWNACVRDGGCPQLRDTAPGSGNRPVLNVSRSDAVAYADWLSRKTGKFYRPMKSGGWSRSNAAESRGADARYGQDDDNDDEPGARDCGNRGEWRWMNDEECNRQGRRAPRRRDADRGPSRDGGDVSGFRVARTMGADD
jgi:formylglycine-generating enzyme required for sulfatase activity